MKYAFSLLASLILLLSLGMAEEPVPSDTRARRVTDEAGSHEAGASAPADSFVFRHFKILALDGIVRFLYSDQAAGQVTDRDLATAGGNQGARVMSLAITPTGEILADVRLWPQPPRTASTVSLVRVAPTDCRLICLPPLPRQRIAIF